MRKLLKRKPKCPYCGEILNTAPKRKKKCPYCGQYIFVRKGQLLTDNGVKKHDAREQERWAIESALRRLENFDVTRTQFERRRTALSKKFGTQASINDTMWSILNGLVTRAQSHHDLKMIYLEMAIIVRDEGRDPTPYLAEMSKQELLDIKKDGLWARVKVSTCNDAIVCSACRKLESQTFTIDEALATLPVPTRYQSEGGCRCWYGAVVDVDETLERLNP